MRYLSTFKVALKLYHYPTTYEVILVASSQWFVPPAPRVRGLATDHSLSRCAELYRGRRHAEAIRPKHRQRGGRRERQ